MMLYVFLEAIKELRQAWLSVKVASPVNQSPAIARRMDDFPIPAWGVLLQIYDGSFDQKSQMQKIE